MKHRLLTLVLVVTVVLSFAAPVSAANGNINFSSCSNDCSGRTSWSSDCNVSIWQQVKDCLDAINACKPNCGPNPSYPDTPKDDPAEDPSDPPSDQPSDGPNDDTTTCPGGNCPDTEVPGGNETPTPIPPETPDEPSTPDVPSKPEEPSTPEDPSKPGDNSGTQSGILAYEQEVVTLVNQERAKNGLPALTISAELCAGARLKSEDMYKNNYFSHTSPTYGSPFDMMKSLGITYGSAGENIAHGQSTPASVMNAWMNSEGHRANILSSKYTTIGVGYIAQGNYWTQWFIG